MATQTLVLRERIPRLQPEPTRMEEKQMIIETIMVQIVMVMVMNILGPIITCQMMTVVGRIRVTERMKTSRIKATLRKKMIKRKR